METTKTGKDQNRKRATQEVVRHTINESSRQFPDDAAIACDYKVKVVGIELLSFQIRIVNCLTDKAKEIGIDWWVRNPMFLKEGQPAIPQNIKAANSARVA